ncbi:hypothetical protein [Actinotignum urinale]|uniref:hypothetical protein n=1 Tax=Actinotignum urinale TaxID=190146 RepID=UPI0003B38243|nr:hypothetical protein [Actinotignum urinale]MDY5159535.1 hypothetical protein [Actinotignum urinale]
MKKTTLALALAGYAIMLACITGGAPTWLEATVATLWLAGATYAALPNRTGKGGEE